MTATTPTPRAAEDSRRTDWHHWARRWDAQQTSLVARREERFTVMLDITEAALAGPPQSVLDLACGTGDIARRALERFPEARVTGVDADPLLLAIAEGAVGDAGGRARWCRADLRDPSWPEVVAADGPFDAVLTSTALHWLPPASLAPLYRALATVVREGGLVVNADILPLPASAGGLAAAAQQLREACARQGQEQAEAEGWAEWWSAAEACAELADLLAERAAVFEDHPDVEELPGAEEHQALLVGAGFGEAAVVWRFYDYAVLAAVKRPAPVPCGRAGGTPR